MITRLDGRVFFRAVLHQRFLSQRWFIGNPKDDCYRPAVLCLVLASSQAILRCSSGVAASSP